MEWYVILLLVLAGIAVLYLLIGFIACFLMAFVIKHPMGKLARPNYDQMREICKDTDFSEYNQLEKEEFVVNNMGAGLQCVFVPAPDSGKAPGRAKCVISAHGFGLNLMFSARYVPMFRAMGYSVVIYF